MKKTTLLWTSLPVRNVAKTTALFLKTLAFILLFCLQLSVKSEILQKGIKGKVTGASGEPLDGVTVSVEQSNTQTATNSRGEYTLTVPDNARVLVFSYVGYNTQNETIGNRSEINVTLTASANNLNEITVIGYGTQKRKELVGSTNTISTKDFGNNSATNSSQLIQGKAAGVQVVNNNGVPGAGTNIIIRGAGSFLNLAPLYVIDGIQGDAGLFNAINPLDIESITILKDASSTAIYGSAAANGVVIITTKRAHTGAPRISFTTQWGVANREKKLNLLNAAQYVDLAKDYAASQGATLPDKFNSPDILVTRTDWQDAIFRKAVLSTNSLSMSGGSDKVLYNFSIGYNNQGAIEKNYQYRNTTIHFSLEENLGRFRFGQTVNFQYQYNTGNTAGVGAALYMPPYFGIYDSTRQGGFTAATNVKDLSNAGNPLVGINTLHSTSRNFLMYPQIFGEVNIIPSVKFRSQVSFKFGGSNNNNFQQPYIDGNDLSTGRSALEAYSSYTGYLIENFATFDKTYGKHHITATAGNSYRDKGRSSFVGAIGTGIANDNIQNISVALTTSLTGNGAGASVGFADPSLISYFGRLNYTFNDKYIISGSVRRDGSSVFGSANRFGNFPGVGVAWNAGEESFIKGSKAISNLKLRASWGKTGNNNIGSFLNSASTYSGSPTGNLVYTFGSTETYYSGTTINSIPNPLLKWEETIQTDAGLDLGLLNNSLNFTLDLYNRKNNDLLVYVPIPNSNGIGPVTGGGTIPSNAASAQNKGVELTVNYNKTIGNNFHFSVTVNGAYNNNNVLSLGNQFSAPIRAGSYDQNSAATYTAAGSPIGSFYGYVIDHVAIDQADIDKYNANAQKQTNMPTAVYQNGAKPGDFLFKDLNGDGVLDDKDQKILGNPLPKFVYGGSLQASYKNFDLNISTSGVTGLKLYNELNYTLKGTAALHNTSTDMLNRWRKPGDIAQLPRAGQDAAMNLQPSDFYIENGAFFRVKMINIGYTLPKATLGSLTKGILSNVRVYIAAENLITITKYTGYDPELSSSDNGSATSSIFTRGIDTGQLPQPRTFLAGLQIGL